jgi:hypothetical protein
MEFVIGFVIGLLVGGSIGAVGMGLMIATRDEVQRYR